LYHDRFIRHNRNNLANIKQRRLLKNHCLDFLFSPIILRGSLAGVITCPTFAITLGFILSLN